MMTTSQRTTAVDKVSCPMCGALREQGGCHDSKSCADALTRREGVPRATSPLAPRDASLRSARVLEVGFDALAILNIGLVMCSATGQVLGCNAPAQAILSAREGLEQGADGALTCTEPASTPLAEIVQEVAMQNFSRRQHVILPIRRVASRRPLTVFLRACSQPPGEAKVAVLVMIFDSGLQVRAIDTDLRHLYGFTSTEARLANLLMEGQALETCCEQMCICRSTGCTHLRRLFKKTGAHRQGELVALLLKGIGLARMIRPEIGDGIEAGPAFADPDRKIPRVEASGAGSER